MGPNIKKLVMVPALIALAVTVLRLVGELAGGPAPLFSREAGGGGALVGIVWLIPIFGIYFAVKLIRSGYGPESVGKTIGFSVLALVAAMAIIAPVLMFTGDPAEGVSLRGAWAQQLGVAFASLVALFILSKPWPAFFKTMLAYAFASRIPVLVVMLIAMLANWGTHYELPPPGYPEMGVGTKFVMIGVFPQMTVWIMFTVLVGTFFGGLTALVLRSKASDREAAQAT